MVDRHRKDSLRFLRPDSSFSDEEIKILMSLRLLLWPTAFKKSILSNGALAGYCGCGSVQTASHLLLIPRDCAFHSEALKSIPSLRHSGGVKALAEHSLHSDLWKIATMEHVETPDVDLEAVRTSISQARGRYALSMPSESVSGVIAPQHWKPDGVLCKWVKDKLEILLIDITYTSDDKLVIEDEIMAHWGKTKPPLARGRKWPPLDSNFFNDAGQFTVEGINSLPEELAEEAKKLNVFHPARYAKRYKPLATELINDPSINSKGDPRVVTIAVGVAGWIPSYTWSNLKLICKDEKELIKLTRALRLSAQVFAVKAWRAFRNE